MSESTEFTNIVSKESPNPPEIFKRLIDLTRQKLLSIDTKNKQPNRIAVVVSVYNGKELLLQTLREINNQIRSCDLTGEIFLILNNGGGNASEFLNPDLPPDRIDNIKKLIGIDQIIFGQTEEEKESPTKPQEITLNQEVPMESQGIRLVVIKQTESKLNRGKIRALRDIYEYLGKLNEKTGYCPHWLLAIDAETRLRIVNENKLSIEPSGLEQLLNLSNNGKRMVGAKLYFTPYDNIGNPDLVAKIPPMQEAISMMHGMPGYQWLPGGATLGGFPEMVAILSSISQLLPGTRIEDVLTTVVAKALDIQTMIASNVIHTNRCPAIDNEEAVFQQMLRWLKGYEGLKRIAGEKLTRQVIDNEIFRIIAYPVIQLTRTLHPDILIKIIHLLRGLKPYIEASKKACENPDDFLEGEATFD